MFDLNIIAGEVIGGIYITVIKTPDGNRFFHLQADNDDVLPVLDVIENTLIIY